MKQIKKPILGLPCKQHLADFTATEKGYHCASCDHHMVDFRGKSTEEIHEIVTSTSGRTCGIFTPDQYRSKLAQVLVSGVQRPIGLSLLGILGFLGPILTTSCSESPTKGENDPKVDKKQQAFNNLKFPMHVAGTLVDEVSKQPLPNASLSIYQNGKIIRKEQTDDKGNFDFVIEKGDLISENFELIIQKGKYASDTLKKMELSPSMNAKKMRLTLKAEAVVGKTCVAPGETGFIQPVLGEPAVEGGIYFEEEPTISVGDIKEEVDDEKSPLEEAN